MEQKVTKEKLWNVLGTIPHDGEPGGMTALLKQALASKFKPCDGHAPALNTSILDALDYRGAPKLHGGIDKSASVELKKLGFELSKDQV